MAWTQDPGIGSELALCLNYFLGMLGVLLALLPVSRSWLHEFILHKLTARETLDAILLALPLANSSAQVVK